MMLRTVSGHPLSRLGVGASKVGSIGNPVSLAEIRRMLAHAIDLGVNVFDTADIYGQGDSEHEIGKAVRAHRDRCFVATKIGQRFSTSMRLIRPLKPILKPLARLSGSTRKNVVAWRSDAIGKNFEPDYLREALEASLRRLRLDHIDAVLLHGPTEKAMADGGVIEVLEDAQRRGLVRYFGVSCDAARDAEWALSIDKCSLVQLPVDLLTDDMTADLGSAFHARSIGVFAREVLRRHPDLTPSEAVRRYIYRPDITSTIVGVSTMAHLRQLHEAYLKT